MRFLLFLFTFFLSINLLSQIDADHLDSLKQELAVAGEDDQKLQLLSDIGEYLLRKNPQEALSYSEQLMSLSRQKESHRWMTTAYYLLARVHAALGSIDKSDQLYEQSLEYELSIDPVDNEKLAWVEVNYGNHYKRTGRYHLAIPHFKNGIKAAQNANDKAKETDCLINTGAMYLYLGNNDSALAYFNPAKALAYEIKDTSSMQTISNNMANVYEIQGKYEKALKELELTEYLSANDYDLGYVYGTRGNIYYYQGKIDSALANLSKSIDFFKSADRLLEQGMVLQAMAEILKDNGNYQRARKEFKKAEDLFTRLGNDDFLTGIYINTGSLFKKMGQKDSSYHYYKKSLELAKKVGNPNYIGISYQNLGYIEKDKGNYRKAADLLENSLSLFKEVKDKRLITEGYVALAGIYAKMKAFKKAEHYIIRGVSLAEELGSMKLEMKAYDSYIEIISLLNHLDPLYEYHNKQIDLLDSLKSKNNANAAEELSVHYELKEKEDSIKIQHLEIENQQAINDNIMLINKQRGKLLWGSLIGGIILLSLLILLFVNRKKLQEKNKENELLLGEIHHRVKNNLQVISSLLSLHEKSLSDEGAKKAILEGKERVKSMGLIHKMLYQNDNFSGIEMQEYVEKLVDGLIDSFGKSTDEFDLDIDFKDYRLDVDTAIPIGLMLNELVINSLKYAYDKTEKPYLKLALKKSNENIALEVEDNGDGDVEKVENSDSFGVKLVKSLVRQLNGEIKLEKKKGLRYLITIKDFKLV